jgi:hypothetical protein
VAKPRCETRWCDGGRPRFAPPGRARRRPIATGQVIMASVEVSNVRKSFGQFRGDSRRLDQGKDGAPIIAAELRKRRPKPHSVWHLDIRKTRWAHDVAKDIENEIAIAQCRRCMLAVVALLLTHSWNFGRRIKSSARLCHQIADNSRLTGRSKSLAVTAITAHAKPRRVDPLRCQ